MTDHRTRMAERRQRQLARVPGFTPVPNARVDAAILQVRNMLPAGIDAAQAMYLAIQQVAGQLPALRFQHRHREPRPSKSDDPLYRNPALRGCAA